MLYNPKTGEGEVSLYRSISAIRRNYYFLITVPNMNESDYICLVFTDGHKVPMHDS